MLVRASAPAAVFPSTRYSLCPSIAGPSLTSARGDLYLIAIPTRVQQLLAADPALAAAVADTLAAFSPWLKASRRAEAVRVAFATFEGNEPCRDESCTRWC
jgi:hypothetical protein